MSLSSLTSFVLFSHYLFFLYSRSFFALAYSFTVFPLPLARFTRTHTHFVHCSTTTLYSTSPTHPPPRSHLPSLPLSFVLSFSTHSFFPLTYSSSMFPLPLARFTRTRTHLCSLPYSHTSFVLVSPFLPIHTLYIMLSLIHTRARTCARSLCHTHPPPRSLRPRQSPRYEHIAPQQRVNAFQNRTIRCENLMDRWSNINGTPQRRLSPSSLSLHRCRAVQRERVQCCDEMISIQCLCGAQRAISESDDDRIRRQ